MILQRPLITVKPHLTNTGIVGTRRQYCYSCMSLADQIIRHTVAFLLVIHRQRGIIIMMHSVRRTAHGRKNKRNMELTQLLIRMGKIPSQENNPGQPFFLHQFQCYIHLILIGFHMPDNHGIFFPFDFILYDLDGVRKKGIGDSLNQHSNTFSIRALQISGAVIRNVPMPPDCIHNHLFGLRIDIRMVINSPGYCTDPHITESGNILNRYFFHIMFFPHTLTSIPQVWRHICRLRQKACLYSIRQLWYKSTLSALPRLY